MLRKTYLPLAASLALGVGLVGNAQAGAYALAYNHIFGGTITTDQPGNITFLTPIPTSAANATLNGAGISTGGAGVLNAPVANAPGSAPLQAENAFIPLGPVGDYANGDALIKSQQTGPGTTIEVVNIAEGHLDEAGNTQSGATNSSATQFEVDINVAAPGGEIRFAFFADPYLRVFLHPNAEPGSLAQAGLSMSITITDLLGGDVFSWAPNGILGDGIIGGTEKYDDGNLNLTRSQLTPGLPQIYDPTADASFGGVIPGASLRYEAFTDPLPVGMYRLTLVDEKHESLVKVLAAPEPGTLLLLGIALVGLPFSRRQRGRAL